MKSLILLILGTFFFTPVSSQITITSQQEWNDLVNAVTPYFFNVTVSGVNGLDVGNTSTPNPIYTGFRNLEFVDCTFQNFDLEFITRVNERFAIQNCNFSNSSSIIIPDFTLQYIYINNNDNLQNVSISSGSS